MSVQYLIIKFIFINCFLVKSFYNRDILKNLIKLNCLVSETNEDTFNSLIEKDYTHS